MEPKVEERREKLKEEMFGESSAASFRGLNRLFVYNVRADDVMHVSVSHFLLFLFVHRDRQAEGPRELHPWELWHERGQLQGGQRPSNWIILHQLPELMHSSMSGMVKVSQAPFGWNKVVLGFMLWMQGCTHCK